VLADAKRLGYAEADESLDVEGWDTAHKASVLAFLAHGVWVKTDQMIVEGISRITPADFKNAATLGYGIKLLAVITRDFATNELSASACIRRCSPRSNVVANVSGVFNAHLRHRRRRRHHVLHRPRRRPGRDRERGHQRHRGRRRAADHGKAARTSRRGGPPPAARGLPARAAGEHSRPLLPPLTVKDQPGVLARVATVMARNR
jgi:homoserine dehydrogenase